MDKLSVLKSQKDRSRSDNGEVRKMIYGVVDADSFVELESFRYSHSDYYGDSPSGEGVVTGFATLDSLPVYVAALNGSALKGGLGSGNCRKMAECMKKAGDAHCPVIYFLSSEGILACEGADALEGVALLLKTTQMLKGVVPQIAVCYGKLLGSATLIAAQCDYRFYMKGACVAFNSPLVIAAKSGMSVDETKIGGAANGNGLCSFEAENLSDVKAAVCGILDVIPAYGGMVVDCTDDPNRNSENLNDGVTAKALTQAVFDNGTFIEFDKNTSPEVFTGVGRIGGYSAAAIIFGDGDGVYLNQANLEKIVRFTYFASDSGLPLVTFVNTLGLQADAATNGSFALTRISELMNAFESSHELPRVNVIYGKAIGLGYTLFGTKTYGADYAFAFATAEIGAVSSDVGAEMEYAMTKENKEKLKESFSDNALSPFNTAKGGYIDDVIEPQYVRQYIIAALQMIC